MIHRGDLQAALAAAASQHLDITVKLGVRALDFVTHPNGVTVSTRGVAGSMEEHGIAFIAADGLWSVIRSRLGHAVAPRFAGRTAWRGLVPARAVAPEFREPQIQLWLGRDAHLVHYPVKAGRVINVVVITGDSWNSPGWSEPASRAEIVPRLAAEAWAPAARALVGLPEAWLKWALYDRPPLQPLVARSGGAARRRRPSDAAVSGARRRHGDRRRRGGGPMSGAIAGRRRRRDANLLRDAARAAPARCNERRGATARVITSAAPPRGCATASCGRLAEHGCWKTMIGSMTGGHQRRNDDRDMKSISCRSCRRVQSLRRWRPAACPPTLRGCAPRTSARAPAKAAQIVRSPAGWVCRRKLLPCRRA